MSNRKNTGCFIVLIWLFFWPLMLSWKAFKWGWSKNKALTAGVTAFILIMGMIGAAANPGTENTEQAVQKNQTSAKPTPSAKTTPVPNATADAKTAAVPDGKANGNVQSNGNDVQAPAQASNGQGAPQLAGGQLKVHFIDVGQADSILVQAPGGKTMLIDAGNNGDGNAVVGYLRSQGVGKIDVLVGTHPHEDHIGGLDTVINSFSIGTVYMPKASNTTKTFEDVLAAIKNKGLKTNTAQAGIRLDLGEGVSAEMLAPNGSVYSDLNDWSAVIKLTYVNNSFLLTGDAEAVSEQEMLGRGYNLKADVLKVGHHGSSSSTTAEFLDGVNPKYAVISVGAGNDYGHPHITTMQKLQSRGIPVYRTDQNGTVVAVSDGNNIQFNTNPGDYSYVGDGSGSSQQSGSSSADSSWSSPYVPQVPENNPAPPVAQNSRTVFFTPAGKSYHYDKNCRTLARSKTILQGTLQEAISSGHADPCDVCVY